MKFKNFEYTKKKDGETRRYLVMVLEDTGDHFGGIELGLLEDNEIASLLEVQRDYEKAIAPFNKKAYRAFIKENVVNHPTDTAQLPPA